MKKIIISLFMLLNLSCDKRSSNNPKNVDEKNSPEVKTPTKSTPKDALILNIDKNSTKIMKKSVYGFNTSLASVQFKGGFADPNLDNEIKILKPENERFPGGTKANFYHWKPDPAQGGTSFYISEVDGIQDCISKFLATIKPLIQKETEYYLFRIS